jgi:hypothetical protein
MAHHENQGVRPLRSDPFFVPACGRHVLECRAQPIDRRPVPPRKGVAVGGQGNVGRSVSQLGRDVDDGLSVIDGVARILAVNGEGKGVPQNYVRAYMWYNLAASQYASSPHYELYERDRESAEKLRDLLARKMTNSSDIKPSSSRTIASQVTTPKVINSQVDEKDKLLKSNSYGYFQKAKKIKKSGKQFLKIWEPQLRYVLTIFPTFLTTSGGVEKLNVEYDEIWIFENTEGLTPSEKTIYKGRNDLTKLYWKNNKVQACSVEKWFISNPSTGENLSNPSNKIWNLIPRDSILKEL